MTFRSGKEEDCSCFAYVQTVGSFECTEVGHSEYLFYMTVLSDCYKVTMNTPVE